jgi:dTDP-4-amino-4,6-dideoxygalactose transaminase
MRRAFLPRLGRWTARRREIAATYLDKIANPRLTVPRPPPDSESCWHLFPVLAAPGRKGSLLEHLGDHSVRAGEHYPTSIPDQVAMRGVPWEADGDLSRARRFCASEVSLPIHPYLRSEEVARVIQVVNDWRG